MKTTAMLTLLLALLLRLLLHPLPLTIVGDLLLLVQTAGYALARKRLDHFEPLPLVSLPPREPLPLALPLFAAAAAGLQIGGPPPFPPPLPLPGRWLGVLPQPPFAPAPCGHPPFGSVERLLPFADVPLAVASARKLLPLYACCRGGGAEKGRVDRDEFDSPERGRE